MSEKERESLERERESVCVCACVCVCLCQTGARADDDASAPHRRMWSHENVFSFLGPKLIPGPKQEFPREPGLRQRVCRRHPGQTRQDGPRVRQNHVQTLPHTQHSRHPRYTPATLSLPRRMRDVARLLKSFVWPKGTGRMRGCRHLIVLSILYLEYKVP